MQIFKIEDMKKGWFIGDFEPSTFKTSLFEVGTTLHPKGSSWDTHYHKEGTEINYLVEGKMTIQNKELNKGDIFISLKEISEECIDNIQNSIRNKITIEEYLDGFVMPTKTVYEKKKPLLIESDSEPKEIKAKKKKIILEETKPVSLEKDVQQNKKPSRKVLVRGKPKNKSRRRPDIKKRRLLIVESDTEKI